MFELPQNRKKSPFIYFTDSDIDRIKSINKDIVNKSYVKIKDYLYNICETDEIDIFNPFNVAIDIDRKYHKFAWVLMAKEIKMLSFGILWRIDKEEKHLEQAKAILNELLFLHNWSDDEFHKKSNIKNAYPETAATIRCVASAIDIFGESLGIELYTKTKKRLAYVCQRLYELIENKETDYLANTSDDWSIDLASAMGCASIILIADDDRAKNWINTAHNIVMGFLDSMPSDGSHTNGLVRWEYTLFNVCFYAQVLNNAYGIDYRFHKSIEKARHFAILASTPMANQVSLFDQGVDIKINNPTNGLLSKILTHWYQDGIIYWGIKNSPIKNHYHPAEIFYANMELEEVNPKEKFGSVYFPNAGYVFLRSGWNINDNMIAFKASKLIQPFSHNDQNNIELTVKNKEMFIESGICYTRHPNYSRRYPNTKAHNVIMIDGKGQLPNRKEKKGILEFVSNEDYDYVVADASHSYSKAKIFNRNLLYIKPNVLILYDYIQLNTTGQVEWLWHSPYDIHVHPLSGEKSILIEDEGVGLSIFVLEPKKWSYKIETGFRLDDWVTCHEKTHNILSIKGNYNKTNEFLTIMFLDSTQHESLPCKYEDGIISIDVKDKTYNITHKDGRLKII